MNLSQLFNHFKSKGGKVVYVKRLSPNDNSKNQIYLGGSFETLNVFPLGQITFDDSGDWNRVRFKCGFDLTWLNDEGEFHSAPNTQLILYPKYPEVRLSGFLLGATWSPNKLLASRDEGRLLFLSIDSSRNTMGYVAQGGTPISEEFNQLPEVEEQGVFSVLPITDSAKSRKELVISQLQRIHQLGWIDSKRLDSSGQEIRCDASNCGGFTLEAELGIIPNAKAEPDYLGWEVKQFSVSKLENLKTSVITLMTPEPTGGFYRTDGVESFVRKFGYKDKTGRENRMNFGGIHSTREYHETTGLRIHLKGFDCESSKIRSSDGAIQLLDRENKVAAQWGFSELISHWNRKHSRAVYVPSLSRSKPDKQYHYGNNVLMGEGTSFELFLKEISVGNIYYDPGIKLENMNSKPTTKRRSQFRIKSRYLSHLYHDAELTDVNSL